MKLPNEIEMELETTHPMLPGGLMFFMFPDKDKKKMMENPDMHRIWNSPFYDITDNVQVQLTLNVYEYAKSYIGSRLFNTIGTELAFLPKDQSMLKSLLENKITGYGTHPNRKYAVCLAHKLNPIGRSDDIHVREYEDGRFIVTTLMKNAFNSKVGIYPQITYDFLKNRKHRVGVNSAEQAADTYEKESFNRNSNIAMARLNKQVNGNKDLPQLVGSLFKNLGWD